MKIVILDGYTENPGDLSWAGFEAFGQLVVYDRTPEHMVVDRIGDAEIVIDNKTAIDKKAIQACPSLRYIGMLATGYNVVDIEACARRSIVVTNIPTYGTAAVSQMAIALLLELCNHVGAHSDSVFSGEWQKSADWCYWKHPLIELAGKTLGIIGFGRIGQATGKIAQALGMKVLSFDENQNPDLEGESCRYVSLDALLSESDVISLHCPLFPATKGIINHQTIAKMKNGVLIINTSRGGLIVEEDLRLALESGKVGGAGLDVVSSEPIKADNPLLRAKNCIITPHIAWAAQESRKRLMNIAIDNLKCFLEGNPVNVVAP